MKDQKDYVKANLDLTISELINDIQDLQHQVQYYKNKYNCGVKKNALMQKELEEINLVNSSLKYDLKEWSKCYAALHDRFLKLKSEKEEK